jgi:hypothetical protein
MVKLYLRLIDEGRMTADEVPIFWREKVKAALAENNT